MILSSLIQSRTLELINNVVPIGKHSTINQLFDLLQPIGKSFSPVSWTAWLEIYNNLNKRKNKRTRLEIEVNGAFKEKFCMSCMASLAFIT